MIHFTETYLQLEEKVPRFVLQCVLTLPRPDRAGKNSSEGTAKPSLHTAISQSSGVEKKQRFKMRSRQILPGLMHGRNLGNVKEWHPARLVQQPKPPACVSDLTSPRRRCYLGMVTFVPSAPPQNVIPAGLRRTRRLRCGSGQLSPMNLA